MSIRIIPAPARVFVFFDDGLVPLTAKIVDDEYWIGLPWQRDLLGVQTYYQDEPFKLITFAGDDEPVFVWPTPKQGPVAQLLFEDDALPNASAFVGDDGLCLQTFASPIPAAQYQQFDDNALPITSGFTPLFRKTLSGIGGRIGQRQLQG